MSGQGWATLAAVITTGALLLFGVSLCRISATSDTPPALHPDVAAAQKQDADMFGQPHPRIRLVPRPEADLVDLEEWRRRNHPTTQQPQGPAA